MNPDNPQDNPSPSLPPFPETKGEAPPPPPGAAPDAGELSIELPVVPTEPADATPMESSQLSHTVTIETGVSSPPISRALVSRVAVIGVVVALLAAGMVAVSNFGAAGGADSPEAAVQQMFASLENEDLLGVAELVDPAERRTLIAPGLDMVSELQRLRVLAGDFDLGSVNGIDFSFENMTYTATALSTKVTSVEVNGTATTTGDASALPLGQLVLDNISAEELRAMQSDAEVITSEAINQVSIATVERDGKWYISLWYSVAEAARAEAGLPVPAFGEGPSPAGGQTPEQGLELMLQRAASLDLNGIIASLDPEETAALYDYSTLFIDDAQRALDAELGSGTFAASVERVDARSEIDGDDAQVWIEGIAATIEVDGEAVTIDTAAACLVEERSASGSSCVFERSDIENTLGASFDLEDIQAPSLRMHRVDGLWYLSPTSSMMIPMLEFLRSLDPDQLERWVENPELLLSEGPAELGDASIIGGMAVVGIFGVTMLGRSAENQFEEVSSSIDTGGPSLVIEAEEVTYVTAFTVADLIPAGTPIREALVNVSEEEVPEWLVPPGAITDLETLRDSVTAFELYPDTILTELMFVPDSLDQAESEVAPTTTAPLDNTPTSTTPGPTLDLGLGELEIDLSDDAAALAPTTTVFELGPIGGDGGEKS